MTNLKLAGALAGLSLAAVAAFACSSGGNAHPGTSCPGEAGACGSSGGSSGGDSGSAASCFEASMASACAQCAEQSCSGQLSSLESACSAYLGCVCPGGVYDGSLINGCQPEVDAACSSATSALEGCETSRCATACGLGSSSTSSSSGSAGPIACLNGTGTSLICQVTPGVTNCGRGSIPSSVCPAANAGCCTLGGVDEICFYDPGLVASRQTACAQSGGTWSTTP